MSRTRIYQPDTGPGWSWKVVGFSLVVTLCIFWGLPFLESLIQKAKRFQVRQVDHIEVIKAPPEIPPPVKKEKAPPKPKLNRMRQQLSMMKMSISLGLEPGAGDFGLDFGLGNMMNSSALVFDIEEVDKPPKAVYQIAPVYPLAAKHKGVEGQVVIKFVVQADGSVTDVKVVSARPADLFEQSAINAVRKWRFKPGTRHNQPVATRVEVPLEFKLER